MQRIGTLGMALVALVSLLVVLSILYQGLLGQWTYSGVAITLFGICVFVPLQIVTLLHAVCAICPRFLRQYKSPSMNFVEKNSRAKLRDLYTIIGYLMAIGAIVLLLVIVSQ